MRVIEGIDPAKLDRGRSWFVLFGAFITFVFATGSALTLGTLFQPVTERIKATTGEQVSTMSLTVLFALCYSLQHMVGFLAAAITAVIGYRATIALGAILSIVGFGLSALATRVWHLYLTMGFLTGTGFGLSYTPAIGVLSYYFSKRYFSLAGGVATSGSSVGIMVFSRVRPLLHANLSWPIAMLVEAGFCAMLFTSAIAIKRPDVKSKKKPLFISPTATNMTHVTNGLSTIPPKIPRRQSSSSLSTSSNDPMSNSPSTQYELVLAHHKRLSLPPSKITVNGENFPAAFDDDILAARNSVDLSAQTVQELRRLSIRPHDLSSEKEEKKRKRDEVVQRLFRPELFRNGAFYLLMIEATCILANSIFLVLTPGYLTGTQGWSSTKSAGSVLTVYGAAALVSRLLVVLINFRPAFGNRIPKTAQIAVGIFLTAAASTAYLFAQPNEKAALNRVNSLSGVTSSTTSLAHPASNISWLEEPNAWLFTIFATIAGFAASFVIAYQPPLLHEVLEAEYLTAAFGYENVVLGALNLALCPVAGIFADAFGTLRYAYAICLLFDFVSAAALIGVVVLIRVRARRAAARVMMTRKVNELGSGL